MRQSLVVREARNKIARGTVGMGYARALHTVSIGEVRRGGEEMDDWFSDFFAKSFLDYFLCFFFTLHCQFETEKCQGRSDGMR